jgi:hypothetical protein
VREERSNKSVVLAPGPAGAGSRGHIESRMSTFKEKASQPASSKQSGMRPKVISHLNCDQPFG